jgi:hypothetical protein
VLLTAALAAALLLLAACGGSSANAADLLKHAQDKMATINTLHFIMNVDKPGTGSIENPYATAAQGDVKRPDGLNATATVNVGIGSFTVQLVILGSDQWLTNPLTGKFEKTSGFDSFLKIFDPQTGLGTLLTALQGPSKPTDGSANGIACWKISGTLDPQLLQPLFGDITAAGPVPTTFCIGKDDGRLYQAVLTGKVTTGDTAQTVRTFFLSKFDAPVTITTPTAG